jgi:hypothetical protein
LSNAKFLFILAIDFRGFEFTPSEQVARSFKPKSMPIEVLVDLTVLIINN